MSSAGFSHQYQLKQLPNGSYETSEPVGGGGSQTINDPKGDTLTFGEKFTVTNKYGTETYRYEGTILVNGHVVGFCAVDPATEGVYMFTDQVIPQDTHVVIDIGEPFTICFMAGTEISTPDGLRAVETLNVGDLVLTHEGAVVPVRWVGRQTVSTVFGDTLRTLPIRIEAGALGENLPVRDLLVSPEHALFLGGVLIQAGALVNGTTIRRESNVPESFIYYHVELADHSLLLAEGVAAETFIDNVDRRAFDNWNEHADAAPMSEMEYARAKSHRQVPASVRNEIAARARMDVVLAA